MTVLTAAIGVLVPLFLTDWFGPDDDDPPAPRPEPALPFPQSRLVSSERVGLYQVEVDGSSSGATDALGQPEDSERSGTTCTMAWDGEEVLMELSNLGGEDPCVYGRFCSAHITGRDWATTKGLQIGEPVRRMMTLYPRAERVKESGEIIRYVLEPGTAPCGQDAEGGLEAWTSVGKVFALRVSFHAGGD